MAVVKVKGDLIELAKQGQFDYILHGCNCFNLMGAGIAKQIAVSFPNAALADRDTVRGDIRKLGDYSVGRELVPYIGQLYVINLYTQFQPGANFNLHALSIALTKLAFSIPSNSKIGVPRIGAGIGGGHWGSISKVLYEHLERFNLTIVTYVP